ncbi:spermidine synthase [Streptomyces roseicoloratus]|uniref:Polyamine aminopropyltransferase n=1 Tax=Streptomyces roseicoloratus TaxID=2508722 RepID=A0ABY9RX56_9ACTN|nr:spermidine synthase [Streptomyces roseicoloratus]WMX46273.1 spermidine synthase [Streptomyces roseicoloratus]
MIDPPVTMPLPPKRAARLPVRPGAVRYPVLAVVFVCAACGLVYELELVALASYLIGDSVTQASVVLSVMVFAMGVGSLLAKRLRCRAAVGFGLVEGGLALIGGCSAMVLYAAFAWLGESRYVLVAFSLAIGVLIGAEIPLLMSLIQRAESTRGQGAAGGGGGGEGLGGAEGSSDGEDSGDGEGSGGDEGRGGAGRREGQDAAGTVADLFAADYVGALVGGLAFPFLLLPWLGQLTGALVTGAVNAVAGGGLVLWLFRHDLTTRSRTLLIGANVTVLAVLATATLLVDDFEEAARRAVYGDSIRVAVHTDLQEVVVTGERGGPPDLFLNGRLRVGGQDEYRYHEALVHPAMNGPHARVLILGGGDGLAAREVLRYPDVRAVTVVELDPGVVRLARTDPDLAALNGNAFGDPRVTVVHGDAFTWLRRSRPVQERYDVVISDLPDPGITPSAKLYSEEFYGLAAGALSDVGRLVVHAGSAAARPRTYWTVDATLRAAGFATRPYGFDGRASGLTGGPDRAGRSTAAAPGEGEWGFLLAAPGPSPPVLGLDATAPRLRSLTTGTLTEGVSRVERTRTDTATGLPPSTLVHPRY